MPFYLVDSGLSSADPGVHKELGIKLTVLYPPLETRQAAEQELQRFLTSVARAMAMRPGFSGPPPSHEIAQAFRVTKWGMTRIIVEASDKWQAWRQAVEHACRRLAQPRPEIAAYRRTYFVLRMRSVARQDQLLDQQILILLGPLSNRDAAAAKMIRLARESDRAGEFDQYCEQFSGWTTVVQRFGVVSAADAAQALAGEGIIIGAESARTKLAEPQPVMRWADVDLPELNQALMWAADGYPERVDELLAAGADPNGIPLIMAIQCDEVGIVEAMLAAGADPNRPFENTTPLVHAAGGRHPSIVRALIQAGADVNLRAPNGVTPLARAHAPGPSNVSAKGGEETRQLLLAAGARA